MVRVVLNIVFLAIMSPLILADDPCKYTTSYGTIDISSLSGTGGSPRYKDIHSPGSGWSMFFSGSHCRGLPLCHFIIEYSFNPCKSFSEGGHCRDAAVCQSKHLTWIVFFWFNAKFYLFSQWGWY